MAALNAYRIRLARIEDHIPWNAPWYQRLGLWVLATAKLSDALRDLLYE